ncbi:MAG: polyprenyl synthetase family protein [Sedimentisphaerales bacterium]|nr:polyprenyl synthetase family protein [Sedimentisphaerales bacterium]
MKIPQQKQVFGDIRPIVIKPFERIEKELAEVRTLISKKLPDVHRDQPSEEGLRVLLRHIQARSGKMLRPGLLLLCGLCCGQPGFDSPDAAGELKPGKLKDEHIRAAAIFEIIHNATLLHDDVIDQAQKRRGSDTINMLYGNESAVLLGDFLLSKVFGMSAELETETARVIALAAGETCRGEINQNLNRDNWQLSEQQYIRIITDKTASLFKSGCFLGAKIAGGNEKEARAFVDFGQNFGIAFQLTDDLLDITGDEKLRGKKGCDLENANPTLPLIRLIWSTQGCQKSEIITRLRKAGSDKSLLNEINIMLEEQGCLDYTKQKIEDYKMLAIDSISEIEECTAKKALIETIDFIIDYRG